MNTPNTNPQLIHLDTINPRCSNLLYGIYPDVPQSDISFSLSKNFYNINFNEKSWLMGNKH